MHTISTISILAAVSHVSLGVTLTLSLGKILRDSCVVHISPNAISGANVGDTITFQFRSNNHSVTQSSFIDPCHRPTLGAGISSGFQLITNPIGLPEFSFTLNTTAPLWFFCAQTQPFDHCQMGMVFAINPTPDETFDMFQSTAQHGPLFSASLSTISSSAFPGTSPSTSMMRTSPFPVGSMLPSLPPTSNDKLKVSVPVGAIVGGAVGGVMVLIDTNTTPPHITPFDVTPSGSAMLLVTSILPRELGI
ncbi:hypothetical protein BD779DRAFT_1804617 [Infundibulicybe gibba]|nr:hypothetical protein BD779DRAFT_1804617 [Infundibulicybe gibba]